MEPALGRLSPHQTAQAIEARITWDASRIILETTWAASEFLSVFKLRPGYHLKVLLILVLLVPEGLIRIRRR
jgi:hypothetical protein